MSWSLAIDRMHGIETTVMALIMLVACIAFEAIPLCQHN